MTMCFASLDSTLSIASRQIIFGGLGSCLKEIANDSVEDYNIDIRTLDELDEIKRVWQKRPGFNLLL
jgi:hypothetical protein